MDEGPCILARMGETIQAGSKAIIEYLARGVEFAAALIIGLAAIEATFKALLLFVRRSALPR